MSHGQCQKDAALFSRLDAGGHRAGGFVVPADGLTSIPADAALLVDCLLGTGLARPVTGLYSSLIGLINEADVPVLSCDVPSGVNADDGAIMGAAVQADCTVVMGLAKPACELRPGCERFGEIEVCDIGLPPELIASLSQWVSGR